MKTRFNFPLATMLLGLAGAVSPGIGMAQNSDQALHDWQLRRLMQPLPHERQKERSGNVYIYDGLTEREVEAALGIHFDRIQYMMFVGTVKTDANGQPLRDEAGQPVQESGGCSSSE